MKVNIALYPIVLSQKAANVIVHLIGKHLQHLTQTGAVVRNETIKKISTLKTAKLKAFRRKLEGKGERKHEQREPRHGYGNSTTGAFPNPPDL